MRKCALSLGLSLLLLLFSARASFAQAPSGAPLISEVTPPSLAPAPSPSQIVQFTLTIVGANFPSNAVVKLTVPEGPSLYAASASVNATGTQIVAQFNTTLPRPAAYAVTVANAVNNPTRVSNVFYLPVTPPANTVGVAQTSTGFLSGLPEAVAVGDFNGDGYPDIAVVSQNSNTVSILLGAPGGPFASGASYPTGNLPAGIVAADFNGDGVLDLAFTNAGDNTVTIMLGNGDGTFRLGTTIGTSGVYPTRLVAVDFNADGALDLAVINLCGPGTGSCYPQAGLGSPGSVALLLGNGDGTFTVSANSPATGIFPRSIAAADLNADGAIDLVITNQISNTLTLLMGNGDGTFTAAANVPTGNGPWGMAVADFNNDGKLDLAVTNVVDRSVSVFLNQNCGVPASSCTFTANYTLQTGTNPIAVSAADMNADGYVDLIVLNGSDNTVTVIPNNEAAFAPTIGIYPVTFSTSAGPDAVDLAMADFNGDGRLDMVTLNQSGSYSLLLQTPVPQVVLTSSNTSAPYGLMVTFTVNVVPAAGEQQPTGTVSLYDGTFFLAGAPLSGNQASFSISSLAAGTHQITATYWDPSVLQGTSNAVTETVSQAPTTVTLNSNVNTVPYGRPFTLSATVQSQTSGTPTGTVRFFDTSTSSFLPFVFLANGVAQLTLSNLSPGAHVITATYLGDFNFTGSTSPTYQENITQATTTVNLSVSPAPAQFAQAVTFTAAFPAQSGGASGPTGNVSFYDGSTLLGTSAVANNSATFSTSALAIGLHSISAQYSGDVNFLSASSSTVSSTVTKAATTTTVSSSLAPSVYGQNVTFSATTTPAFGSLPAAGQISFFDGTTLLATVNATSGVAQYTLQSLTGGTHSITAQWLPTYNYATSTSTPLAQIVTPAATTLTLSTNINPSYAGQQISVNISLNPAYGYPSNGATFTIFDNGNALSTWTLISGSSGSFPIFTLAAGTHVLTATYAGDANLQGSSTASGLTQTVNQASTSSSAFLTSYSTLYGASVTISGTLSISIPSSLPPTGTFSFYDGTTLLGTAPVSGARAQYTTSSLLPGTHPITVQYSGDANFLGSTSSPAQTLTVSKDPTLTSVSVDVNPSTYAQTVTLTAAVQLEYGSGATGSVSFLDGTTVLGTAPYANGGAKLTISTLGGGSHSITAQYSGDTYFASSTSTALTQTVNPAPTSISVASGTNPSTFGQALTLTATVQPPAGTTATGSVTFVDGSYGIGTGTLANNTAQLSVSFLTPGSHSVTVVYAGNANLSGSTSSAITETITQAATTTSVASNLNPASFGQCVQLSATVQPASGTTKATGTVSFLDGSTSIGTGTLANNVATLSYCGFVGGTHTITANYGGDSNYITSASPALTETVNPASSGVTLASSQNPAPFGSAVAFTATVVPSVSGATVTGGVTFYDGSTSLGVATVSGNSAQLNVSSLAAGPHSLTAKYSGDGNFNGSTSATLSETVNAAPTTTKLASSLNPASYGQSVTLSTTIQPPSGASATGTVTFFDGSTSLGTATISGNATQLSLSSLLAGTHSITAVYSGNSNLAGSTSSTVSEVVNPAATTTTISSIANPASVGQVATFSVSVQPAFGGTASGGVSFYDGTVLLGTVSLTNNAGQLSVSTLGVGSHSITAAYNGDASTTASTSSVLSQTINPAATTTTFTANPNPSVFNQWISFVVTVAPATGGTPTGTVTLMDGINTLSTATLSTGVGRISYSGLAPGTHSITAVYSGDANFTASTSAAQNVTVNQASTTTSVSSSLNPATYGQALTFTASVQAPQGINPFGTVTFMDGSTTLGSASLSNGSAQLILSGLAAGSHSITAAYGGNTYLTGSASATLSESVSTASSVTTVSSSANPATFSQAVVLSASIQGAFGGNATGTVTFLDGATALGTAPVSGNAAQLSVSSLAVGSHSITAKYNGDANVAGSTSAALTQTVSQAGTTTTVTSGANPAVFEQSVTFSVRIQSSSNGTPTGTVTLMDGSGSLGSTALPANGVAQFAISSLVPGAHAISASYSGDANFGGSTSAALSQVVNGASTTTAVSSSTNPSTFGQGVTLSATIQTAFGGNPTGTITFLDGTTSLGTTTVSSNGAQLSLSSLSAGAHQITAKYNGDANFSGSTSPALTQTINQASTTTVVVSSTNPSTFGQTVTLTASVQSSSSGTPTGNVTFFDGSTSLGSVNLFGSSAQLTLASLSLGSHSIAAKYNGDSNYAASSSASLTQSVSQSGSTTSLSSNANPSSFGQAVTFTATVQPSYSGTPNGSVTFFDGGTSLGSISLTGGSAQLTLSNLSLGAHSISAKYGGDSNFTTSTSTSIAESVNQAGTATTVSSNVNPTSYGQIVTFTATVAAAYSGTPTGNVTFFDGSTSLGNGNLSGGVAIFSTQATALVAGSHSITAKYNGDSHFLASTSAAFVQTVGPAATVTTLASNANPSPIGQSVNFTAHVSSAVSGNLTGTVNFYLDGGTTPVFSVALSGGNAQYTTSSLSGGTHSITAAFVSTNANFNGSTSTSLTQTITDFINSASPASDTIARGSSGTYTLTVTPIGGLTGNVSLNCNGAPGGTHCSISPGQVTLNGVNSVQASVTVTVDKNATVGTYTLTLKATSGPITHSTTVTLTID
ncbi:MAG TPA: Ig-like domain repeat protein [Candidatus Acidoferrum sp.]|nr:Ig-like domain repeat protein [Candidatus Acidoferrum sp.]